MIRFVFLLLALTLPAQADCLTPQQWQDKVAEKSPGITVIDVSPISDDLRMTAAVEYNQTPPIRDPIMPDQALLLIAKSKTTGFPVPYVLIGFFDKKGCWIGTFQVPIVLRGDGNG